MAIDEGLETIYNFLTSKYHKVLDIFENYYGRDRVEIQNAITLNSFIFRVTQNFSPHEDYETLKEAVAIAVERIEKKDPINLTLFETIPLSEDTNHSAHILVFFPEVTITNEYNRSVTVKELWVKVPIYKDGTTSGSIYLSRSDFPESHARVSYVHSHVYPRLGEFSRFCLGLGPLVNTISYLATESDKDMWELFCWELEKALQVESNSGGPYISLEKIEQENTRNTKVHPKIRGINQPAKFSMYSYFSESSETCPQILKDAFIKGDFIRFLLNKKILRFVWGGNSFKLGMSFIEYAVKVSNAFIEWCNISTFDYTVTPDVLIESSVLVKGDIKNLTLFELAKYSQVKTIEEYNNMVIGTFKGNPIKIKIYSTTSLNSSENYNLFLNQYILTHLIGKILKTLNYRYGRNSECTTRHIAIYSSEGRSEKTVTEVRYF